MLSEHIRERTREYWYRTGGHLSIQDAKRRAKQEVIADHLACAEFEELSTKVETLRQVLFEMNGEEG